MLVGLRPTKIFESNVIARYMAVFIEPASKPSTRFQKDDDGGAPIVGTGGSCSGSLLLARHWRSVASRTPSSSQPPQCLKRDERLDFRLFHYLRSLIELAPSSSRHDEVRSAIHIFTVVAGRCPHRSFGSTLLIKSLRSMPWLPLDLGSPIERVGVPGH